MKRQFIRFLMVGALATTIQYLILILLVRSLSFDAVIASGIGFIIAAITNYHINYHFTFHSNRRHHEAATRFFIVAMLGVLLNSLVMSIAIGLLYLHYLFAQTLATVCVLFWNFTLSRLWTFNDAIRVRKI